MVRARREILAVLILSSTLAGPSWSAQQDPEGDGEWEGPWDWRDQVECQSGHPLPGPPEHVCDASEMSHASLLPTGGMFAGMVLMWRNQRDESTGCEPGDTTDCWLFDPSAPDKLIRVEQTLSSDIFCGAVSWQQNGQLLVAGGNPVGNATPTESYRFRPNQLGIVRTETCNGTVYPYVSGMPWTQIGDIAIPRYYATLVPLVDRRVEMDPCPDVSTAPLLLLGGPPQITNEGNELWELINPPSNAWSCPVAPATTPPPHSAYLPGTHAIYAEVPTHGPVEVLLDSYPRTYQFTNGELFVSGDVDTVGPANTPGNSWLIQPSYASSSGGWELHSGVFKGDPVSPANPTNDRFYGTATFFHTLSNTDRTLVFGGSQNLNYGSTPQNWVANDSVQEWEWGASPPAWRTKATMWSRRTQLNSVILPTGDVFLVGGSDVDYFHANGPNGNTIPEPVFRPELFKIGLLPSDLGFTVPLEQSNPFQIYGGAPGQTQSTPRIYHSVALLLTDGRVFVAGGQRARPHGSTPEYPAPEFSGELFSPPYMFYGFQPIISDVNDDNDVITFNEENASSVTFTVDVSITPGNNVNDLRVVLLRPGAVTHHACYNQIYVELPVVNYVEDINNPGAGYGLHVESPQLNLGPPGWYMLFVVEQSATTPSERVPSKARLVKFVTP